MLETKVFEIRDRATFFVAFAMRMVPTSPRADLAIHEKEAYLLRRDAFGPTDKPFVVLCRSQGQANYDPYAWADRTYMNAHWYITDKWDELMSGDVIDVEFVLGETKTPKLSERLTVPSAPIAEDVCISEEEFERRVQEAKDYEHPIWDKQ